MKDCVRAIGEHDGRDYANLPVCLSVTPLVASVQTGGNPVKLAANVKDTAIMCSREALFAGRFSRDMKSMSACLPEKTGRVWSRQ